MSSKIKITLGVTRSSSGGVGGNSTGSAFAVPPLLKKKILERDKNKCRACGFTAAKYQEVFRINRKLDDLREENLATLCVFCHQCFHLDRIADMESGVLIWMPEIPQTQLHHIARAIYVARISQGDPMAETARKALDVIISRRQQAKARLGTDDPFTLSKVLSDYLGQAHYKAREKKLNGVRLFPLDRRMIKEASIKFNQFPQMLAYWRSKSGPFGDKSPKVWGNTHCDIVDAISGKTKAA